MNELTDQIITLFSSGLLTVMLLTVGIGSVRLKALPGAERPQKWHIPTSCLEPLDLAMCCIVVLYFSLGALLAAATPPGVSAPPSTTNVEIDTYKVFNSTCLNLILGAMVFVRMFLSGRKEALGLKNASIKNLLIAPVAAYLLVLAIQFGLDAAGLFEWIQEVTNAPGEQSIVTVLRQSSDVPLIVTICFSAGIVAPLVEETVFRGYLYPILKKYTGAWFALISSSLLFGIIHVSLVPFIPLAIFGAILVLLYEYTKTLWAPVIAHAIFNAATLINILYPGLILPNV